MIFYEMLIRLRDARQRHSEIHRQQLWFRATLRILLPILFPIIQRRHGDFGVFRVGMMHRLRIVPQRLLCEPLRVAALQRAMLSQVYEAGDVGRVEFLRAGGKSGAGWFSRSCAVV